MRIVATGETPAVSWARVVGCLAGTTVSMTVWLKLPISGLDSRRSLGSSAYIAVSSDDFL